MNNQYFALLALGALASLFLPACDDDTGDDGASTTDAATTDAGTGTSTTTTTPATSGTSEAPMGSTEDSGPADSTGAPATDDGSGSDDASTGGSALEVIGEWVETFPDETTQTHSITEDTWTSVSPFGTNVFHIDSHDNAAGVLVGQNDAANDFSPNLYSRLEWVWDGADLYYCQSVFDAESADDAWAAAGADPMDLQGGCATFPWSLIEPAR